MPAPLFRFDWKPCAAYVRTEDAGLVAELGRFLDIHPEREEDDPPGAAEATVAIDETKGMFFIATSDWRVRARTRAQLLFAALEGLGQIFIYSFPGAIFHASAFQTDSGAVMFFGAPQSGKSSLGFAAWKRGLTLIGDDRVVLVDEGKRVRPFPKCLKLRLGEDGVLPPDAEALPPDKMVKADLGHEIRLILARSQPGFSPYGSETNVNVLVELERGTDGETSLTPVKPEAALDSVIENVVSPDFHAMGIVRFVKRQAERNCLFRLTVAPGGTQRALDLLLAQAL